MITVPALAPAAPPTDPMAARFYPAALLCPDWTAARQPLPAARARRALGRVVAPRLRRQLAAGGGGRGPRGRWVVEPLQGGRGRLDLEATLERCLPGDPPRPGQIMVARRREPEQRLVVLLDTSLSLRGDGWIPAAVTAAVLARETPAGSLALIAFHAKAQVVIHFGQRVRPLEAAFRTLRLPLGGVTDLAAGLAAARRLLAADKRPGQVVLISDMECTAGKDPRREAALMRGLNIVLIGGRNLETARLLARLGKGRLHTVNNLAGLPSAVMALMLGLARPHISR